MHNTSMYGATMHCTLCMHAVIEYFLLKRAYPFQGITGLPGLLVHACFVGVCEQN